MINRSGFFKWNAPSGNSTYYFYQQLAADTGFPWRDGNMLQGDVPNLGLVNFDGWNPISFNPPEDSTTEVLDSSDNGVTWGVSAASPSSFSARHHIGYAKRNDGLVWFWGGDANDPTGALEVWTYDGNTNTYNLITSDWGIGNIYIFSWCLINDKPVVIGGQKDFTGSPLMEYGCYIWNDDTLEFELFATLPAGYYAAGMAWSNNSTSCYYASGGRYMTPSHDNFNDKIFKINLDGTVTQIATLPTEMLTMYGSSIRIYDKYWFLKGVDTSTVNDVGLWYTDNFSDWTRNNANSEPQASHARGVTEHEGVFHGAFGNTTNDSWIVKRIVAPSYVSPLLANWYDGLSVKPTEATMTKFSTFADTLNSDGVWYDIAFMNVLRLMETEEQQLTPFITLGNASPVNNGVPYSVNGRQGNGSSQYINLGFNLFTDGQSVIDVDDVCIGMWSFTDEARSAVDFGALQTGKESIIWTRDTDTNMYIALNRSGESVVATADSLGYRAISRTSSAGGNIIVNNTVTPYLAARTDAPNVNMYGCANNNDGTANLFSSRMNAVWFVCKSSAEPFIRAALTTLFS